MATRKETSDSLNSLSIQQLSFNFPNLLSSIYLFTSFFHGIVSLSSRDVQTTDFLHKNLNFEFCLRDGGGMASMMRNSASPLLRIRSRYTPQRRRNPGFFFSSKAGVGDDLPSAGVPTSVPVRVAHQLLQAGHRYLDVRTSEEFALGRVPAAANIPYMFKVASGMTKNTKFLDEISEHFGKDDHILLGCQSGKRSLMAASDLQAAGYTGITDIAGGYAAWTQNGLPTES